MATTKLLRTMRRRVLLVLGRARQRWDRPVEGYIGHGQLKQAIRRANAERARLEGDEVLWRLRFRERERKDRRRFFLAPGSIAMPARQAVQGASMPVGHRFVYWMPDHPR